MPTQLRRPALHFNVHYMWAFLQVTTMTAVTTWMHRIVISNSVSKLSWLRSVLEWVTSEPMTLLLLGVRIFKVHVDHLLRNN